MSRLRVVWPMVQPGAVGMVARTVDARFAVGDRVVLRHPITVALERFEGPGRVTAITAPDGLTTQRVRVALDDHDGRELWVASTKITREPPI